MLLVVAVGGVLAVAWLGLSTWQWTSYDAEARPAFDALLGGHVLRFLQLAPAYGGSLMLRAPFVLATKLWGGGELSTFRAAAAPCLAASALLALWLVGQMRERGASTTVQLTVLLLCIVNPVTLAALDYGHPEDLLGGVLSVAAVLVATRGRGVWAGALLGLAVANKEWAVLAAGPVLVALPSGRVRAFVVAVGVAGLVLGPLVLVGSAGSVTHGAALGTGKLFNPWQLWWFLGSHARSVRDLSGQIKLGYRAAPGWVGLLAHPMIAMLVVPLTLACLWLRHRGGRRPAQEGLLLLMLLFLLRFALDPWDNSYYPLPFVIALLTWEAMSFRRAPALTLLTMLAACAVFTGPSSFNLSLSPDVQALIFLVLVLSGAVAIALALYAPGLRERVGDAFARRAAVPTPA